MCTLVYMHRYFLFNILLSCMWINKTIENILYIVTPKTKIHYSVVFSIKNYARLDMALYCCYVKTCYLWTCSLLLRCYYYCCCWKWWWWLWQRWRCIYSERMDFIYVSYIYISFVDINNECVTNDDDIKLTEKIVTFTSLV